MADESEIRAIVKRFNDALEGDSGDEEIEAAIAMRDELLALIEPAVTSTASQSYQDSYAASIHAILPDDLVLAVNAREIDSQMLYTAIEGLVHGERLTHAPEIFVELDRAVISDLETHTIQPTDLLSHLRIAVIRRDSDNDIVLHITTVERIDRS